MTDPRLNSVHLEFPRRDDFRRARQALLDARGQRTLAGELYVDSQPHPAAPSVSRTQQELPKDLQRPAVAADHWLEDNGRVLPLRVGVNTIGRLPDNDVVLEGAYVSRRHCAIMVHSGAECEIYDIASKNGTFVNGMKLIGPTRLNNGDLIRMCDRDVVFMTRFGPRKSNADQTQVGESG